MTKQGISDPYIQEIQEKVTTLKNTIVEYIMNKRKARLKRESLRVRPELRIREKPVR